MKGIVAIFFLSLYALAGHAQEPNIDPLIKAWSVSDTSQTRQAEKTYQTLKDYKDSGKYKQVLSKLYAYLDRHADDRLRARILMFDVLGNEEYSLVKAETENVKKVKLAIQLANKLEDEQLLAEIYALAGQIDLDGGFLLYNLKAVELQKKIGFQYFSFVQNRFFNISYALYRTEDYKQSITYGLEALKFKNVEIEKWDPRVYIFQLDIIGVSYKQLKQYDSAKYYYQQIIDTLQRKPDAPYIQELWLGIAKGNIGHILSLQDEDEKAIPLITTHLKSSIKLKSWNNAAMAQNALANIYLKHKWYPAALKSFRSAYVWAIKSNKIREMIAASKGLAKVYRLTGQADSAYHYYDVYYQYQDTLATMINKGKLSAINAKIAFDNLQGSLEKANATIDMQRLTRNFIIMGIVLLTVIALLFYNRKMLQQKHLAEKIFQKQKDAEREVRRARVQMVNFTQNIIEKDRLIQDLQKQVDEENGQVVKSLLNYTLITDIEWEKFRLEFSMAYPLFLPALHLKIISITPAEERLATLLYLKLTAGQIANTLGIGKDSVGRSKRRLKQRLNLKKEEVLEEYLALLI